MIGRGRWDSISNSLYVGFEETVWHIMIRRCDGKACEHLRSYDGRDVSADAIKEFLPNWEAFTWSPNPTFGSHASFARDGDLKVRLLTTQGSPLSHDQIVGEFKKFMANSEGV